MKAASLSATEGAAGQSVGGDLKSREHPAAPTWIPKVFLKISSLSQDSYQLVSLLALNEHNVLV